MSYLAMMREMDLEVTSEFLVMAANLLYIKSKMLLPRPRRKRKTPGPLWYKPLWNTSA
jgi:segregation and condensation protein A